MEIETKEETEVTQFVNEHGNTGLKLDLLFFWSKYPYAKFTSGIIARALDCKRKTDIEGLSAHRSNFRALCVKG